MVMAHPVPVVCADWHVGTGYSPPARNEAVSPESAISSGSANWRINPLVSKALKTRSRLLPPAARLATATPKGDAPESNVPRVVNIGSPAAPPPVLVVELLPLPAIPLLAELVRLGGIGPPA